MNWNSKSTSEVNKERIWKELIISESRDLKIFDRFRASSASTRRAVATPVSERDPNFLNKSRVQYMASCLIALPELRATSQSRCALPFHNMESRMGSSNASPWSGSSGGISSPIACASSPEDGFSRASTSHGGEQTFSGSSRKVVSALRRLSSNSGNCVSRRPTSGSDYGSCLEPLVKHRVGPFSYGVTRSRDLCPAHVK